MERQRREKEQAAMAEAHYTAALLRGRGLAPWKLFVGRMKEQRKRAEQFHLQWRSDSEAAAVQTASQLTTQRHCSRQYNVMIVCSRL